MSGKIDNCFARLRNEKRKGFIPYICAGDPNLKRTVDLAFALEKSGADLLELGLPFSDPLADGIVNQLAAQRALAAGTTIRGVFDCVREIRKKSQIPIVLYSYLNPIFQFGAEKFHREAADAGVDGLLILDLPPEEDSLGGHAPSCPKLMGAHGAAPSSRLKSARHRLITGCEFAHLSRFRFNRRRVVRRDYLFFVKARRKRRSLGSSNGSDSAFGDARSRFAR